jgi:hypothetical protein
MHAEKYHQAYDLLKVMAREADAARRPAVRAELDTVLAHLVNAWNLAQYIDCVMADPHSDRGCRRRILPCSRGGRRASSCERPGVTIGMLARAIGISS